MKTPFVKKVQAHPFAIFGVGVLTGAVIVSLILFFKVAELKEFQSAVLRGLNPSKGTVQMAPVQGKAALPTPTGNKNAFPTPPNGMTSKNAFPTPPNGVTQLPTPTGN
ncbi:hypothetical protein KBC97_00405 [Candidatus Gracilibacteria bacterium]|nr:hypothetical protein [Candidatus Gracilibacteria bacterium]